jgi:hypothetical protein
MHGGPIPTLLRRRALARVPDHLIAGRAELIEQRGLGRRDARRP